MNQERGQALEEAYLAEHPGTAGTVEPYVYDDLDDVREQEGFPFPVVTNILLSEDWEPTDQTWFVDSSGFGQSGEPALNIETFRKMLYAYLLEHPDHGLGLSGVGDFQVYVTAYQRIKP